MAKQGKPRKPDSNINSNNNTIIGKGSVTPAQVAFIVDRYLADNNFPNTRSAFRSEAASLISKSDPQGVPVNLLSLGELLEEYIMLKAQKVIFEQEKIGLSQEKSRVQTLLQGMQDLINAFNSPVVLAVSNCVTTPPQPTVPPPPFATASMITSTSSASGQPVYRTPIMRSMSMTQSVKMDHTNFSTPMYSSRPPRKRKNSKDIQDAPQAPKKYCGPVTTNTTLYDRVLAGTNSVAQPDIASSSHDVIHQSPLPSLSPNFAQGGPPIQGSSSVAKNLFDKPSSSPNSSSSGPKTPPRPLSSQSDKNSSPLEEISSTAKSNNEGTPPETTTTNCTFISSKTIIVSPAKQYSFQRNQCTFSSPVKTTKRPQKREHVKGRLDFDSSDVPTNLENTSGDGSGQSTSSESEKEGDTFELEVPNFDVFGPDFSLTEFLTDFGIDCGATDDYSCPTTAGPSADATPEAFHEGSSAEFGTSHNQDFIQHSSEVFAGDVSVNGTESVTSVKSIRKCIRIVSPTKCSKDSSVHDQASLSA